MKKIKILKKNGTKNYVKNKKKLFYFFFQK